MGLFKKKNDIYVIPDTQVKPGVQNPLVVVAKHICDIKPKKIIHLGDHWDLPSLSKYDKGKKSHRVRNYLDDLTAGNEAMQQFWKIIRSRWRNYRRSEWIILQGNHEHRRHRALEYGPDELVSLIEQFDFNYHGWDRVVPFLVEVNIEGINFSHYFQQDNTANAISSAAALLNRRHQSCVAGHKQGFDYKESLAGNGKVIQCLVAGSCYYHNETYKHHTNHHFRGTVLLSEVNDGMFDFSRFGLKALKEKYG